MKILKWFEPKNPKSAYQNQKIEIGIIEAQIRIEATDLPTESLQH